jgi:hypothetical protein
MHFILLKKSLKIVYFLKIFHNLLIFFENIAQFIVHIQEFEKLPIYSGINY